MTTPAHTFEARYTEATSDSIETKTKQVAAAYFNEDGDFTVFKDADHAKVFAVRSDCLLSVERLAA